MNETSVGKMISRMITALLFCNSFSPSKNSGDNDLHFQVQKSSLHQCISLKLGLKPLQKSELPKWPPMNAAISVLLSTAQYEEHLHLRSAQNDLLAVWNESWKQISYLSSETSFENRYPMSRETTFENRYPIYPDRSLMHACYLDEAFPWCEIMEWFGEMSLAFR